MGTPSLLRLLLSSFQFTPAIQSRSTAAVTQPVLVKQSSCCKVLLALSSEARVQQKVLGKLYHPILIGVWYIIYPIYPCLSRCFSPSTHSLSSPFADFPSHYKPTCEFQPQSVQPRNFHPRSFQARIFRP